MALLKILLVASVLGIAVWIGVNLMFPGSPPELDPNEWWGEKDLRGKQDTSIRPFKIKFTDEMIKDLKSRLSNHRKPAPGLEGAAFTYGFNSGRLSWWTQYWSEKYPFSDREQFLNSVPQYVTNIQGLDVHFIRVKPKVSKEVTVVPLLLLHGWPGSVREFYEAIPLLTTQTEGYDFVFEVIVPSLPGYGFSQGAVRPGLGAAQIGVIMKNLMNRLGHKKFYIQGGDWGAIIADTMATLFQNEILGMHSNMLMVENTCSTLKRLIGAFIPSLIVDSHLADRMYPLTKYISYLLEEFGYLHLQATKPDTIGVALSDSPAGLAAYILEKFSSWTRMEHRLKEDGGLTFRFTANQLIDNLMMYWTSNSITTSMRLYAENMSNKNRALDIGRYSSSVPAWALQAKNELFYQPPHMIKSKYSNLLGVTVLDDGGHFIAFEMPKVFAEDVFKAVKAFREFHKTKTEL
ncbi:unnamed protein product [Danaus chrysippus]|uniref:Epoxide hydrolase n=1 Tax=Danaus chrysippus TaxID=151541 RepID=A0A8J2VWA3_9NEOP|nr:unnamed protein product [Danaus chrysippus]